MVRKLKHHEQKLLRKVDFVTYKSDGNHREAQVMRRYSIQKPSDYTKYNRMCGSLRYLTTLSSHQSPVCIDSGRQLAHKLADLDPADPIRHKHESLLLEKLYDMGILGAEGAGGRGKLSEVEKKVTVSSFCRRRLPVVMSRMGMADTLTAAITYIEQGHVRVGADVVTDPAFLVTRNMEDFVNWVDSSKIKRNIAKYKGVVDDFDLL